MVRPEIRAGQRDRQLAPRRGKPRLGYAALAETTGRNSKDLSAVAVGAGELLDNPLRTDELQHAIEDLFLDRGVELPMPAIGDGYQFHPDSRLLKSLDKQE